ncbi:hypothetical protein, partial [Pantoea allii]|uniref:hypothetical protein n=1 Tax=Pantoea allii TaxID=574096 RepID=UPI001ABF214E
LHVTSGSSLLKESRTKANAFERCRAAARRVNHRVIHQLQGIKLKDPSISIKVPGVPVAC